MTSTAMKAKIVRVKIDADESGLLLATSSDLKGLLVAEMTPEALEAAIPQAIKDLYEACGVQVVVTRAEASGEMSDSPWVAVPAEVAKAALASH